MVSLYGVATVEPAEATGRYGLVRVRDLVEKPPLEEAPSNLADHRPLPAVADDLRHPARDQAGPRRRDPADRRDQDPGRHRAGARRRLHRPALRHRRPGGLREGRRAARLRARRHRPGALGLAAGVRSRAGGPHAAERHA